MRTSEMYRHCEFLKSKLGRTTINVCILCIPESQITDLRQDLALQHLRVLLLPFEDVCVRSSSRLDSKCGRALFRSQSMALSHWNCAVTGMKSIKRQASLPFSFFFGRLTFQEVCLSVFRHFAVDGRWVQ